MLKDLLNRLYNRTTPLNTNIINTENTTNNYVILELRNQVENFIEERNNLPAFGNNFINQFLVYKMPFLTFKMPVI